ncbi:unnamed protein product [Phytophthora lilii]|uniref:Unnamed protein product n=1 Tax=Phytophthora lilii TaxID=2077276 RepID=A0A9W6TQ03_9STRA|nr:unnamed protein product [Phytophthora lilii]
MSSQTRYDMSSRIQPALIKLLTIRGRLNGSAWTVYRPFEAFQRLGQQLAMIFGQAVPACPPRDFDLRFPDSLEKARVDLNMWLMQLLLHRPIYQSHVFVDFVSADANVPPPGLQSVTPEAARGGLTEDAMVDSTSDDDSRLHNALYDDDVSLAMLPQLLQHSQLQWC